jgi:hypothetical protein
MNLFKNKIKDQKKKKKGNQKRIDYFHDLISKDGRYISEKTEKILYALVSQKVSSKIKRRIANKVARKQRRKNRLRMA